MFLSSLGCGHFHQLLGCAELLLRCCPWGWSAFLGHFSPHPHSESLLRQPPPLAIAAAGCRHWQLSRAGVDIKRNCSFIISRAPAETLWIHGSLPGWNSKQPLLSSCSVCIQPILHTQTSYTPHKSSPCRNSEEWKVTVSSRRNVYWTLSFSSRYFKENWWEFCLYSHWPFLEVPGSLLLI